MSCLAQLPNWAPAIVKLGEDLPPELLLDITSYLPTARSVSQFGKASKNLHAFVEKDAWQTFNRTRFPSLQYDGHASHKDAARTLTTLSIAWERRAFTARYVEPNGEIHAYPGDKRVERWKRPKGQTIGFTPQLDVYEDVGTRWRHRDETLAFSAGAEVCVRKKSRRNGKESVKWMTYRPLSAYEGRDDVTTLHLLRSEDESQRLVTGTANGDLRLFSLPGTAGDVPMTFFTTQGLPVRSSTLLQQSSSMPLLAASLGDTRLSLYTVDSSQSKIAPSSSIEIHPPTMSNDEKRKRLQRIWSTQFLSPQKLAVGIGPSSHPIHIHDLTPSGLHKQPSRKFGLQNTDLTLSRLDLSPPTTEPSTKKPSTSIYPIKPLPPSSTASGGPDGSVFLSGAYDSTIRLHDLRSPHDFSQSYTDPTDDSAIYSLLPRGQEQVVAGTSRHSLLKVFDLRLGAKCYSYLDATTGSTVDVGEAVRRDWNIFLKPHNTSHTSSAAGRRGSYYSRSTHESSVYSLASSSPSSPFLYAGVENAVLELGFTSALDRHQDPAFFPSRMEKRVGNGNEGLDLNLAMYDQTAGNVKLFTQRSVGETRRLNGYTLDDPTVEGLDERWRVGGGV
ncbi:hypothetical protein LTR56_025600 [Elasticomyces elasticus]|nr:hypothetical protein LTR56_025600 [Elasticomyces elasticus]KAK3620347.1 hypothetical protein LTR22_025634 [Elasticomyces elasticus]KAK4904448.1 hypothetical protein LTR49_026104 [Elasticomyces elasticus]KAK5739585.1 hypothetical protein LTS12_025234 [Elasticomyces elasticus]